MENSPAIWSRPLPLGWYFSEQWRRFEGPNWIQQKCDNWISGDRLLKNFANELPMVSTVECPLNPRSGAPKIELLDLTEPFVSVIPELSEF